MRTEVNRIADASAFLRLPFGSRWRQPVSFFSRPARALALRGGQLLEWRAGRGLATTPYSLTALNKTLRRGRWWLLVGYEFADRLEQLPRRRPALQKLPELLAVDFSDSDPELDESSPKSFAAFLTAAGLNAPAFRRPAPAQAARTAHAAGVGKIRAAIKAGDYYQANLTRQFARQGDWNTLALADRLNLAAHPAYGFHLKLGDLELISISPELLVESIAGRMRARPIAGSVPRGATPAADRRLAATLGGDPKCRAEHEMLVDLMRNDLGRVAQFGSVRVTRRRVVERHARVLSLVSTVEASAAPDRDALDALWAAFPGGTITGCPKLSVTAALRKLEPCARGYYTGSFGWLHDGEGVFNILIRTLTLTRGRSRSLSGGRADQLATWGAGGGIVYDSRPASEWRELRAKAAALENALTEAHRWR